MRRALALPLMFAGLLAGCGDALTEPRFQHDVLTTAAPRSQALTVMSRNLYLGADVAVLLSATEPAQIPFKVAELWGTVTANDFPQRAGALADEIAAARAHLVGLQEVSTYYLAPPGQPFALVYDYLQTLRDSLTARGLAYDAPAYATNMDVTLPMATPTGLAYIRLVIRDVVLARADVRVTNPRSGNFAVGLTVPIAGAVELTIPRGWASVDADIDGRRVHFVTTHLEAFSPAHNAAQGSELLALLAGRPSPLILVGDLNVTPDGSRGPTYANVLAAGFADVWTAANGGAEAPTCCFDADLSSTERVLTQRIDFIFVRDVFPQEELVGSAAAWTVGDQLSDRTVGGLWPSDHAGLVGELRLPQAKGLTLR
jgi:endonuclease/exonuclease/phosphatase family metal-dependent hydrolase